MSRVPPMKCIPHGIPECIACKQRLQSRKYPPAKAHGPVLERLMRMFYGPSK